MLKTAFFKNLKLFELSNVDFTIDQLQEAMLVRRFRPCLKSMPQSYGWAGPLADNSEVLCLGSGSTFLIRLKSEKKSISKTEMEEAKKERVFDWLTKLGYIDEVKSEAECSGEAWNEENPEAILKLLPKVMMEELEEEIKKDLLPHAPRKISYIEAILNLESELLFVNASSDKNATFLVEQLQTIISDMESKAGIHLAFPEKVITAVMTNWVKEDFPEDTAIGNNCIIQYSNSKTRRKYENDSSLIDDEGFNNYINEEDYTLISSELDVKDIGTFNVNDKFNITKINPAPKFFDEAEEAILDSEDTTLAAKIDAEVPVMASLGELIYNKTNEWFEFVIHNEKETEE